MKVVTAHTVDEAVRLLGREKAFPLAGGTQLMVERARGQLTGDMLVNLDPIEELKEIRETPEGFSIGGLVTFLALEHRFPTGVYGCLGQAAALVGGPQIRNRGTIGGNIMTASPAGDGITSLMALEAEIELVSEEGVRRIPLDGFFTGPGGTRRKGNELLTYIHLPRKGSDVSLFAKVGKRNAMAISIVNMAVSLKMEFGRTVRVVIALGAVAPYVLRAKRTECFLTGKVPDRDVLKEAAAILDEEIRPISDLRATEQYRRGLAGRLLENKIGELAAALASVKV